MKYPDIYKQEKLSFVENSNLQFISCSNLWALVPQGYQFWTSSYILWITFLNAKQFFSSALAISVRKLHLVDESDIPVWKNSKTLSFQITSQTVKNTWLEECRTGWRLFMSAAGLMEQDHTIRKTHNWRQRYNGVQRTENTQVDFPCAPCMTNQTDSASSDDDMGDP